MSKAEAAKIGDIFVTVTGTQERSACEHFASMKEAQ